MGWKESVITVLARSAELALTLRKPRPVSIVTYHRILPERSALIYDEGVVSATPETFEREIAFFKKYFTFMNFEQLKQALEQKRGLPKAVLLITFDDGYVDNYTYAFPILKRYKAPATIFLAAHYIEAQKPYWWDEVAFYLKAMKKTDAQIQLTLRALKKISDRDRKIQVQDLANRVPVKKTSMQRLTMTWNEIREMSDHAIEFGAHTMTHPVLSQVEDIKEVENEIRQSKWMIEERLNRKVIAFSYPFGGSSSFNLLVKAKVKEAGFDFAVTYMHGVNHFDDASLDRFELKRLDMDKQNLDRVKTKLAFPKLFKG